MGTMEHARILLRANVSG